jgi:ABC-type polysaccharide/polyol phosphate export permease
MPKETSYISPFNYMNRDGINPGYNPDPVNLLYFTGISLLLMVLSHRIYKRKDIYT